ncbi:MAG: uncharacterized protein QOG43_2495 [Actinomycetota bacterium]|jgi:predicted RNA-binding protein YlqC (UPF0109 family)|nr:uncharacterized protein [Actinomycetota bacterium]
MTDAGPEAVAEADADLEIDDEVDDELDDDLKDDDNLEDDDDLDDEDEVDGNRAVGGLSAGVLDYLARSIVDDEDAVDIEVDEGRRSVMLRLHVSPSDMGRVIGRRGRVAQAIRTVVRAAGAREGVDASVDIVD